MTASATDPPTLNALAAEYVRGRWKRGEIGDPTRDALTYTLATLSGSFGRRPLDQLGPRAIDRWLETIGDRAPSTRRNYVSRVRHFCRWLVTQEIIGKDPTSHVRQIPLPRRVPVTLTDDQVKQLRSNLPDLRARLIVALMYDVGARCIEVSRLRVEDYDPARRTVVLTGKGDHERHVPVSRRTDDLIGAYLAETGMAGGPLIRSHMDRTQGLTAATLSHYVRGWMSGAGVKARAFDGRSAHGLRRTCGSDVMDACGDVRIVQAVLGHARIETTARYYLRPVTVEQMRSAMSAREADE